MTRLAKNLAIRFAGRVSRRREIPPLAPGAPPLGLGLSSATAHAAVAAQGHSATPPEEFAPLTWEEVRTMARSGMDFGGHTMTHPILTTIQTPEELDFEISQCKRRIERELQAPVVHFAYPSGKADEIPAAAKQAVGRAGFETAATTLPGQVGPGDDRLFLRRIGSAPDVPPLWFQRCAAGVIGAD
jgi:hypothetical protein